MSKDSKQKTLVESITAKVVSLFSDTPEAKEQEFVEAVVKDTGITITADSWEVGKTVTTVTEEGDAIAIPEGTYELENGAILSVDADGVILEVSEVEAEEVEAEKKEEEMKKEEPVFVTEQQLAEAMKPILSALEKVAVQLSATPKVEENKEEADADGMVAENKLLKQRLAEKRKSIADKSNAAPTIDLPQKKKRGHQGGTQKAVLSQFKDFDFKLEKGVQIDLN